jgi:hypothetical protein
MAKRCCLSFGFWLPLWYLLAMVLSVLRLLITPLVSFGHGAVCPAASDYPFGIFWPWCCLKGVIRRRRTDSTMAKRYQRGNQKTKDRQHHGQEIPKVESEDEEQTAPLVLSVLRLLITPLVSFGHGAVCPSSSDYTFGISWPWCCLSFVFWLHPWYLLAMVLSVLRLLIPPLTDIQHHR